MLFAQSARRVLLAIGVVTSIAAAPVAQGTTGVATFNDYTLNGSTPGVSSCPLLFPFPSGPAVLNVNTAPGAPVVFMFNVNCPCRPCFFPWSPVACPLPILGCFAGSNQAFELDTTSGSCLFLSAGTTANSTGNATITVSFPPLIRVSTQAVLIHPCDASNLMFTQAYQVSTV